MYCFKAKLAKTSMIRSCEAHSRIRAQESDARFTEFFDYVFANAKGIAFELEFQLAHFERDTQNRLDTPTVDALRFEAELRLQADRESELLELNYR